jgi:hypothetical protein
VGPEAVIGRTEIPRRSSLLRYAQIASEYQQAVYERDQAAARGDRDTFELYDDDCQRLEQDWNYLNHCSNRSTILAQSSSALAGDSLLRQHVYA